MMHDLEEQTHYRLAAIKAMQAPHTKTDRTYGDALERNKQMMIDRFVFGCKYKEIYPSLSYTRTRQIVERELRRARYWLQARYKIRRTDLFDNEFPWR